jgi:hypothetical protein
MLTTLKSNALYLAKIQQAMAPKLTAITRALITPKGSTGKHCPRAIIDGNTASAQLQRHLIRGARIIRKNMPLQTEIRIIGQLDGLLIGIKADNGGHWAKSLFLSQL